MNKGTNISFNFNLRSPKRVDGKPTAIFAVVSINGKQTKVPTGLKVYPYEWNKDKQRSRVDYTHTQNSLNNIVLNAKLNKIEEEWQKLCLNYLEYSKDMCNLVGDFCKKINSEEQNTKENTYMKKEEKQTANNSTTPTKKKVGRPKKNTSIKASVLLKDMNEELKKEVSDNTKKQYDGYLRSYLHFIDDKDNITSLSQTVFDEYCDLLKDEVGKSTYTYRTNHIARLINIIAHKPKYNDLGVKDVVVGIKKKDNRTKEDKRSRPLTKEEWQKFLAIGNTLNAKDREYFDMIRLQYNCGQRESDLQKLIKCEYKIGESNGKKFIIIKTQKSQNKQTSHIEVNSEIEEILNTYKEGMKYVNFKNFRKNKYNYHIQKLFKLAKLDTIEVWKNDNGKEFKKPLYEAITSHWFRYTFIYNAFKRGLHKEDIAKLVGHNSTAMIDAIYLIVSSEDITEQLARGINKADAQQTQTTPINNNGDAIIALANTISKQEKEKELEQYKARLIANKQNIGIALYMKACNLGYKEKVDKYNSPIDALFALYYGDFPTVEEKDKYIKGVPFLQIINSHKGGKIHFTDDTLSHIEGFYSGDADPLQKHDANYWEEARKISEEIWEQQIKEEDANN